MSPKVSVIIPICNVEQYLEECLNSVVNQTLEDIEIICINDGSTDASLSILESFAERDSRIVVVDKANAGYGAAMNDGLNLATGEYIGIVESDDYILPEMYERYYALAAAFNLDFVKSDFKIFWGDGEKRKFQKRKLTDKAAYYGVICNPSEDFGLFSLNNLTQPGLYKLDFINSNSIRYHESPGASYQDNGFWFQVFAQAKSAMFLHEDYYMLRRDNPNSSVKNKGKAYCICEEYDFIRNRLIERGLFDHLGICAYARFANYEWTCQRVDNRLLFGFFQKYADDFNLLETAGELDRRFFSPSEWSRLQDIMRSGSGYYLSGWLPRVQIRSLKDSSTREASGARRAIAKALRDVKSSNSYRIGRLVTKPVRFVKRGLKKTAKAIAGNDLAVKRLDVPCTEDVYNFNHDIASIDLEEHVVRLYAEVMHGILDLNNPVSYNEKVQYRKLHDPRRLEKARLTDKYLVKQWVSDKIGESYLIPTYGVWDQFEDIDFDSLPEQFVLKATHGCKMTMVVEDKTKLDYAFASKQFDLWMKTNFAYCNGLEMHYKDIQPRIIAEQYIENKAGDLYDYKFWCFDGRVEYIQFLSNRSEELLMSFYDRSWNLQPFRYDHPNHPYPVERPAHLDEMIRVAEQLSEGFDHVRVDLYDTESTGVKFGEMTFSSSSGYCVWSPSQADYIMGELWKI